MQFAEGWIETVNSQRRLQSGSGEGFSVTYQNGFRGTGDEYRNTMTGWQVIKAEEYEM